MNGCMKGIKKFMKSKRRQFKKKIFKDWLKNIEKTDKFASMT
jgi:hypothetical protein